MSFRKSIGDPPAGRALQSLAGLDDTLLAKLLEAYRLGRACTFEEMAAQECGKGGRAAGIFEHMAHLVRQGTVSLADDGSIWVTDET